MFRASKLIAGAEVLKALSTALEFRKKNLFFYRYGDNVWMMEFVASKQYGAKLPPNGILLPEIRKNLRALDPTEAEMSCQG